jgi:hypothetical protein
VTSAYTYRLPLNAATTAAATQITIAAVNTTVRPSLNGPLIKFGKYVRPVRVLTAVALSECSTPNASSS